MALSFPDPNPMVLTNILNRNEKWAEAMNDATKGQFFPKSAQGQTPKVSPPSISPLPRARNLWLLQLLQHGIAAA